MDTERAEPVISPHEEEKLYLDKKYPQSKEELQAELIKIWETIKKNLYSGKIKIDSKLIPGYLENIEEKMMETLEVFDFEEVDKTKLRTNLDYLRDIQKGIVAAAGKEKIEKEIPEMKLDVEKRKKIFFEKLEEIKEKTAEYIKSFLDQLGDDFKKAVKSEDIKEEKNCWLALVSFQDNLSELEEVEDNLNRLLIHSEKR